MKLPISILLLTTGMQGCSVKYTVDPASEISNSHSEICLIEHPDVRPEFLREYKILLETKGFIVKLKAPGTSIRSCELSSTYIGKWSWDFTTYMAFAEIKVYENGILVGNAVYQAPRAGIAMTTKIYDSTESKIRGLVEQLFPESIDRASQPQAIEPEANQEKAPNKETDPIIQLERLKQLRDSDVITEEEFQLKKKELLERI